MILHVSPIDLLSIAVLSEGPCCSYYLPLCWSPTVVLLVVVGVVVVVVGAS